MAKIGIFDSGYGGLTILEAIRRELPQYDYLYLGDNARAPYGTHSFDVIYRYTLQAVKYLFSQDCALVILACNTASAKALRTIQQKDLPLLRSVSPEDGLGHTWKRSVFCQSEGRSLNVLGVIRPTVEAVPAITKTGHIGILATPATVSSESYVLELEKIAKLPNDQINDQLVNDQMVNAQPFTVVQQACPLWVPLIENGEHLNPGADYFVDLYLRQILEKDPQIDTLILGCTHYPLLLPKINAWLEKTLPSTSRSIDSSISRSVDNSISRKIEVISQGSLVARSLADYLLRHPEYESQLSKTTSAPSSFSSSSSSSSSPSSSGSPSSSSSPMGSCHYLTTENADRFSQSASLFLSSPVQAEHIDLE